MSFRLSPYHQALLGLSAIALTVTTSLISPASAQLFNSAVDRLPVQERVALREGRVTLAGSNGQYTGRVLVNAPPAAVWSVLTDYNNFERFFPTVQDSRLLQSNGTTRVFEQVNVVRIFPVTRRTRVVISATESYPQQIAFRLVEGDVNSLQGTWRLDPVAPHSGAAANQVLVTHQVNIDPGSSPTRGLFLNIYQDTLQNTLAAIKQESERRR